jgi:hypothetical protein
LISSDMKITSSVLPQLYLNPLQAVLKSFLPGIMKTYPIML